MVTNIFQNTTEYICDSCGKSGMVENGKGLPEGWTNSSDDAGLIPIAIWIKFYCSDCSIIKDIIE
jgi:hypothetical protein